MLKAGEVGGPSPADMGWSSLAAGTAFCSVWPCGREAVCAVRRQSAGGQRSQAYCDLHAHARGVDRRPHDPYGRLMWSPEFVSERGRSGKTTW